MDPTAQLEKPTLLTLDAETAVDLMTPDPVSIRADASVTQVVAVLVDKGFGAAPVIDDAGRPLGVVSRSDVLAHVREALNRSTSLVADSTRARDIMTPIVFSVMPDMRAGRVIQEMAALKVHRLFVVDGAGSLVGVITALDILSRLVPQA
jgi:predicted transcriptional regulator